MVLNFFSLGSQKSITSFGTTIGHLWDFYGLSVALLDRAQVDCGFQDHFATTSAYLLPKCALSMAIQFSPFRFLFPLPKECLNKCIVTSKKNNRKTHPANLMTYRVRIEIIL